jgi:membrane carboxypeptidase/penicillin-binding protein PbpC
MNFTVANTGGNSNRIYFGLSSGGNTVGQNSTQDAIMLYQKHDINDTIGACDADNAALPSPATTTVSYATGTDYYCEIARTSTTTYTVKMWTGSYGGTVFANESGTCNATLVGLNYIKISNHDTSNVSTWNTLTGTIDDIEFYNGVGSVN